MPRLRAILIRAAIASLLAGCGDATITVPELDVLDEAPITVMVEGVEYYLDADAWRNFELSNVPIDERGLIASLGIRRLDGGGIPRACDNDGGCTWPLTVVAAYVELDGEVWASETIEDHGPDWRGSGLDAYAEALRFVTRDGPTWDPAQYVDIVVKLVRPSGAPLLLRAEDIAIGAPT